MFNSTPLYGQLFTLLRQYSRAKDLRHFKTLAWMVSALIYSGQLSLPAWEPYVPSRAKKAQSVERWQRDGFWAMGGCGSAGCMCRWWWRR